MDVVFGAGSFRNEIIWSYGSRGAKAIAQQFPQNHDVFLYYGEKESTYNRVYQDVLIRKGYQIDGDGRPFKTAPRGDYTDASIKRLEVEERIHRTHTGNICIKYFLRES